MLMLSEVLYCMSQNVSPESFDFSLWSDFTSSQIRSLLRERITCLKQGLDTLGTQLVTKFASCFSKCQDTEWWDGSSITPKTMKLKLPCEAVGIGVIPGNYMDHPIRLSWHIQHLPSTVINLTIEELSLPVFSMKCDYNHVMIEDGILPSINICGKQPKQTHYSGKDFVIQLFVKLLGSNAKLCFSYFYGWYYETSISGKDIHMTRIVPKARNFGVTYPPVEVKLSAPMRSVKGKFLMVADFLQKRQISFSLKVKISTGISIVDIYDGPGRRSPLITHLLENTTTEIRVRFYLYLEFYMIDYDNNTSVFYETAYNHHSLDCDDLQIHDEMNLQCRNTKYWLHLHGIETHVNLMAKSDVDVNTWCMLHAFGKGIMLELTEFEFDGPTVQYMHEDFSSMCQFGGVYIKVEQQRNAGSVFMSLCDDSMVLKQELLLGDGGVYVYIAYFAGYSRGLAKLKIKTGKTNHVVIGQKCDDKRKQCDFKHRVWTETSVNVVGKKILVDNTRAFQLIYPPLVSWLQQYSAAHMSPVLQVTAGSPRGYFTLGTVLVHIEITTTKSQPASCVHKITLQTKSGPSNTEKSYLTDALLANKTTAIPSARYIRVTIRLCPYLHTRNRVVVTVKLEKYKVCDDINHYPWPSQIAEGCPHLSVPYYLGKVSFHTEMLRTYAFTINEVCVDKSCLNITIAGHYTNQCDVLWNNVDVSVSPVRVDFPGKLIITWETKPSCSASLKDLQKCKLEIDINLDNLNSVVKSRSIAMNKMRDRIVLQRNTRKDTIFMKR